MKGSLLDFFPLLLIVFIFTLGSILGYHVLSVYQTTTADVVDSPEANQIVSDSMMTLGYFDELGIFLLLGLCFAREKRSRYSYERIDQEPPRDGSDYGKGWQ